MNWPMRRIGAVTSIVTKGTTPTKAQGFTEYGINYIKAEALNGDVSLDLSGGFFISEDVHQKLRRSILEKGDILLTIAGANIGKCGIVEERHLPANTNQAVGIMRVDRRQVYPQFLYYWFKQVRTFRYVQGLNAQAAQPNINLSMLKNIEVPIPARSVQQSIAGILSAYDNLIENNRRRIQLLEQAARLLYKEWFVRLRFPGHEHTKIVNGIPEGWSIQLLAELCLSIDYGYTASADMNEVGPKFLRITDIVPDYIDWSSVPYCRIAEDQQAKFRLTDGDIVIARTGATVGYAKRLNKRFPESVFASYLVRLRLKPTVDNLMIGTFMESDHYKNYVKSIVGGAAQPNANAKILSAVKILVPPQNIQRLFREYVEPIKDLCEISQIQNQQLRKARDLLLPRLMNGEIAV
jgi:type I restriction enzyme, S subunit